MLTIKLLSLAYLMSLVVMYVVARSAIKDRVWRLLFCTMGAVFPFMFVWAIVKNALRPSTSRLQYCSQIAAVEDSIEAERIRIFGGEPLLPSFSERWQRSCQLEMQRVVVWSDNATRRIRRFKQHWSINHA